jgi:crotonobetainyl-CoA:carnitine CoA-transferase CaiB-like acyl-CoA transferase
VLVENFKVGGLAKFGLDHASLREEFPALVYCSITGFGQTGPYAPRAGYDYLAQGMGGVMSLTGEPDGEPVKVGVGIADVMCGMYAVVAILAALRHAEATGEGQHVDMALLDTQVAWLVNEGTNYLLSARCPAGSGTSTRTSSPTRCSRARTGTSSWPWATTPSSGAGAPSPGRRSSRPTRASRPTSSGSATARPSTRSCRPSRGARPRPSGSRGWRRSACPRAGQPARPGVRGPAGAGARDAVDLPHPRAASGTVPVIANPIRMGATPPSYRSAPPTLGQHTDEVLGGLLGMGTDELGALRADGVIG